MAPPVLFDATPPQLVGAGHRPGFLETGSHDAGLLMSGGGQVQLGGAGGAIDGGAFRLQVLLFVAGASRTSRGRRDTFHCSSNTRGYICLKGLPDACATFRAALPFILFKTPKGVTEK